MRSTESGRDLLGRGVASVLRGGTLVAVAAIGIGYVAILVSGEDPGAVPLLRLVSDGGAPALLGLGLLGLILIPAVALGVAAVGFRQRGEHRRVATSLGVLTLLLASLAVAVVIGAGGAPT